MKTLLMFLVSSFLFFDMLAQTGVYFNAAPASIPYSIIGGNNAGINSTGSASYNAFLGAYSGYSNTTGSYNIGVGGYSLYTNTTGNANVAFGYASLRFATSASSYNTAIGHQALTGNTSGSYNVALGMASLAANSVGVGNTGLGYYALKNNTNNYNTAVGFYSLYNTTSGSDNTALGLQSLYNVATGSNNVGVGYSAGPGGDYTNTVSIGYNATATASNMVVLGNSSITVNGGYQPWSIVSDGRFKTNIKEDVSGLAFIKLLRPVSYTFDTKAFDDFIGVNKKTSGSDSTNSQGANRTQSSTNSSSRITGFIAQEVEAAVKKSGMAFSGVIAPQSQTDHYWLKYSDFVVPLVKAVQEISNQLAAQQNKIDSLTNMISALTKSQPSMGQNLRIVPGTQGILNQNQPALNQNFPNPFTVSTQISMTVPETAQYATLSINNMQGTQLKSILISGRGNVSVNILAGELASGVYLCSLFVDGQLIDTKRMVLTN